MDTATSAEFLNAPVAKALGAPSKMATSGMPMLAWRASFSTVCTSQCSVVPSEPSITRAPVLIFAMGLEMSSEMIAPVKPITAEKTSRPTGSMPSAVRKLPRPKTLMITDSTTRTAMFVARNRTMRFTCSPLSVLRRGGTQDFKTWIARPPALPSPL